NRPDGYSIGCVTYILNPSLHTSFCAHLVQNTKLPEDVEAYYSNQLLQAKRENLVQDQITYLEKLSDLYLQKKNWVQAAKLLNCALAIFEKNLDDVNYKNQLVERVENIEILFLESQGLKISHQQKGTVSNYREWLKNIRSTYSKQF